MGFKSSWRSLPAGLKGLKAIKGGTAASNDKLAAAPVIEVTASPAVEVDKLGLTPPPAHLPAPWVVEEQAAAASSAAPASSSAGAPQIDSARPVETSRPVALPAAAAPPAAAALPAAAAPRGAAAPRAARAGVRQQQAAEECSTEARPKTQRVVAQPPEPRQTVPRPASRPPPRVVVEQGRGNDSPEAAAAAAARPAHSVGSPPDAGYRLPPAIRMRQLLQREESVATTESEAGTPLSIPDSALESATSTGTVVVTDAHQTKLSLSLTASIEDYAKKADPANWGPPKFRKSQYVRVQPGTYAVPFKKLSESRSQYTDLHAYTKGTVHQIHKEIDSRDPREFVADEGLVFYRIWVPQKVNSNVEFIFVEEHQMTIFRECTLCSAYATEQCGGCKKAWYCSEECLASDWRIHKHDCQHKGRAPPQLGDRGGESVSSDTPASSITPRPGAHAAPRRKFRDDGTVKIINGYKPAPGELRGKTTIMPACLRPLTTEEEMAPPPPSRTGRILRAASHRLRRAMYKKRAIREAARARAMAEAMQQDMLSNDAIPEGDEEGSEGADDREEAAYAGDEPADGSDGADSEAGELHDDVSEAASEGHTDASGSVDGEATETRDGTYQQQQQQEADEQGGGRRHSTGARLGGSRTGSRDQRRSSDAPGSSGSRRGLGALKPARSMLLRQAKGERRASGPQIGHTGSFNSTHSNARHAKVSSASKAMSKTESGAWSDEDGDHFSSPLGSDDDGGSPGAESLVEGQPPRKSDRRRSARQVSSKAVLMPQLPRIRVRPEDSSTQGAQGASATHPSSDPGKQQPQPWPLSSSASLTRAVLKKAGSEAAQPTRSDSLPEVFKRLIASSKHRSLGVRMTKDDGSTPTKKVAKSRSPFKQHVPGHRATLLAPQGY